MIRSVVVFTKAAGARDGLVASLSAALGEAAVTRVDDEKTLARKLGRTPPDLVFVDLATADGSPDGLEVIERLRSKNARLPLVAVSPRERFELVAEAVRRGATDFLVRAEPFAVRVETLLRKLNAVRGYIEETQSLEREAARLKRAEDDRWHMVGDSPQMRSVTERIRRVSKVPRPVLIQGERGTGKELVARAIHRESRRAQGPFVAVNCAALPDTLLESELFGHEKGAFTGAAHASEGKFEQAEGGTLFLDEIAHMSLPFQQKILRVVEYRSFTRVGGKREIHVDTRIIAATNVDLKESIRRGRFLADLYDRLAFEVIEVPPLRTREGEIETLANHFLDRFMREVPAFAGKRLSQTAIDLLYSYPFPGNVRELKNIIERAVYRDTTNELTPEDIGLSGDHRFHAVGGTFKEKVSAFERQLLADAMTEARGNGAQAARNLGLRYHQLRHLLKKHGLDDA